MIPVDPLSSSLYFSAISSVSKNTTDKAKSAEKNKGVKKSLFSNLVKDKKEELDFLSQGLPIEIYGMSQEEAVVFLKDNLDASGDALSSSASPESYANYKKAVSEFVRFVVKNNYEIHSFKRFGRNRRTGKARDPAIQIEAINKNLDTLAYDMWYNHLDKLKLLEKVHEINGLIVDLIAN